MEHNNLDINRLISNIKDKFNEYTFYYNTKNGDIVSVDSYYLNNIKENKKVKVLHDWQKEIVTLCNKIVKNESNEYILIPSVKDINEYKAMTNFISTVLDSNEKVDILSIINGNDRIKRFKYAIEGTYLEKLWDIFLYDELRITLINWCNINCIHYKE